MLRDRSALKFLLLALALAAASGGAPAGALEPSAGPQRVTYPSSVDGVELAAELYVAHDYDPEGPAVPLVVYLHGGGGSGVVPGGLRTELNRRGWVGLAPDGREWGLARQGCPWRHSAAWVDSPDPDVGPGEQDVLDAVDWALAELVVDPDRVYLAGFSFGGRGAYTIGLRNPDRFAALGPMAPATDMFEIFVRRPRPRECKEGITGGRPGDSPFVDTMYKITSARFLTENAFALPVFHGHGTRDRVASNDPQESPYLHGWHVTSDPSWNACHGGDLCFGHTPTLAELEAIHPGGYDWSFLFTPVDHRIDGRWLRGTAPAPGTSGEEGPDDTELRGMIDFFAEHRRLLSPRIVVYKSYTDEHRHAYWLELDVESPWSDRPGAVRATRDLAANSLLLELARAAAVTVDLPRARLDLAPGLPLGVELAPLIEPTFDPALALSPGEEAEQQPVVGLVADFAGLGPISVLQDGRLLSADLVDRSPDGLVIGPVAVEGGTVLEITTGAGSPGRAVPGLRTTPPQGSPKPAPPGEEAHDPLGERFGRPETPLRDERPPVR